MSGNAKRLTFAGFLVAIIIAAFISPFASSLPDGLERVAILKGFSHRGETNPSTLKNAPMADYAMPGVTNGRTATGIAGVVGVVATLGLTTAISWVAVRRRRNDSA